MAKGSHPFQKRILLGEGLSFQTQLSPKSHLVVIAGTRDFPGDIVDFSGFYQNFDRNHLFFYEICCKISQVMLQKDTSFSVSTFGSGRNQKLGL